MRSGAFPLIIHLLLLTSAVFAEGEPATDTAAGEPPSPAVYQQYLRDAGLVVQVDEADPRRMFVDYAGERNDWRITVYPAEEWVFLSALIIEVPVETPLEENGSSRSLDVALVREALRRSFALPGYKYALHPDGRRLYLALDLPAALMDPQRLVDFLGELAAACEREAEVLLEASLGD